MATTPDYLDTYVTVNERVAKFREKYPDGIIHTEIVKWEDSIVVMKATIYRNPEEFKQGIFTAVGHAYEKEGSNFINKGSALENAETSAVGRALAFLGIEIKKAIASREEVENAMAQREEKQQPEPQPVNDRSKLLDGFKNSVEQIQKKQPDQEALKEKIEEKLKRGRQKLALLAKTKKLTDEERRAIIKAETGKESSKDLNLSELVEMVNYFQSHKPEALKEVARAHMLKPDGAAANQTIGREPKTA